MKTVLIISSQTAASNVGATASAFCLRRLGVRTIVIPTTLLGRHPGWGTPGGGAISAEHMRSMWEAIKAQDIKIDAVMTGYFAQEDQIDVAIEAITWVKQKKPRAKILVDPVMGDVPKGETHSRLYISEALSRRIILELIYNHAEYCTPNEFEISHMHKYWPIERPTFEGWRIITTSARFPDGRIGSCLQQWPSYHNIAHERLESVPHGCGDSFAALFLGHLLLGETAEMAHIKAVSSLFAMIQKTVALKSQELALEAAQDFIADAPLIEATKTRHPNA